MNMIQVKQCRDIRKSGGNTCSTQECYHCIAPMSLKIIEGCHVDPALAMVHQLLGTHIGSQTMSDIAVIVNDPTHQGRMVSYFDVITDAVFNEYINRGVAKREDMIISKATRDARPLTCNGDTFTSSDSLENWVVLK